MIADINLLPKREKKSAKPKLIIFIAASIFFLLLAIILFIYFSEKKETAKLEELKMQLANELENVLQEQKDLEAQQDQSRESVVNYVEKIAYPTAPLLREFVHKLPPHTFLRTIRFEKRKVLFTADFEDKTKVSLYIEDLLTSKLFRKVHLNELSWNDIRLTDRQTHDFSKTLRYSVEIEVIPDFALLKSDGVNE